MIWGRTTHMGCGWIQFPVKIESKKFEKIYPEGEYENFFVCNYGVGGNVPGEPVYNTDCQDSEGPIVDMNDKLEEILQDSPPKERKTLQVCLDALICLHEKTESCLEPEEKCIESLNNGEDKEVVDTETYFAKPAKTRIEILQCTTDAILCNLKDKGECKTKFDNCFSINLSLTTQSPSTSTSTTTTPTTTTTTTTTESETASTPVSSSSKPSVTITTVKQPITVVRISTVANSETTVSSVMSGSTSIEVEITTASFTNFYVEVTTVKPSGIKSSSEKDFLPENQTTSTLKSPLELPEISSISSTASPVTTTTLSAIISRENVFNVMVRDFEEISKDLPTKENDLVRVCLETLLCLNSVIEEKSCSENENFCIKNLNDKKQVINVDSYASLSHEERINLLQCHIDAQLCSLKQNIDCKDNLTDCLNQNGIPSSTVKTNESTVELEQNLEVTTQLLKEAEISPVQPQTQSQDNVIISSTQPESNNEFLQNEKVTQQTIINEDSSFLPPEISSIEINVNPLNETTEEQSQENISQPDLFSRPEDEKETKTPESLTATTNTLSEERLTDRVPTTRPLKLNEKTDEKEDEKVSTSDFTTTTISPSVNLVDESVTSSGETSGKAPDEISAINFTENPTTLIETESKSLNKTEESENSQPSLIITTESTTTIEEKDDQLPIILDSKQKETDELDKGLFEAVTIFSTTFQSVKVTTETGFKEKLPLPVMTSETSEPLTTTTTSTTLSPSVNEVPLIILDSDLNEQGQASQETTTVFTPEHFKIDGDKGLTTSRTNPVSNNNEKETDAAISKTSSEEKQESKASDKNEDSSTEKILQSITDVTTEETGNTKINFETTLPSREEVTTKFEASQITSKEKQTNRVNDHGKDEIATEPFKVSTSSESNLEAGGKNSGASNEEIENVEATTILNKKSEVVGTTSEILPNNSNIYEASTNNSNASKENRFGIAAIDQSSTEKIHEIVEETTTSKVSTSEAAFNFEPQSVFEETDLTGSVIEKPENDLNKDTTEPSTSGSETTLNNTFSRTDSGISEQRLNEEGIETFSPGHVTPSEFDSNQSTTDKYDQLPELSGSEDNKPTKFNISQLEIETLVTTSTTHPVTSVIDFLTTFETPHISTLTTSIDVSFYNSTAKTSFRLALCLDGVHCKEDSPRCTIIHKECNEGLNVGQLPFQVKKKLSECTVDDILCHLDGKESPNVCKSTYEKCANIVIPESLIHTVSMMENPPTDLAAITPQEDGIENSNPFFTLLALSKLNGGLKENESKYLQNITSSVLKAVSNAVGGIEILKLNSTEELNDWLKQKDTLPIFHDLTVIIPDDEDNGTIPANPEAIDFDLTNSSLIFDPSSLVIGNTNAKDAQILAKNIIEALKDRVHICNAPECEEDEDYGGITGSNGTELSTEFVDFYDSSDGEETQSEKINFSGIPKTSSFAEIQIHLSNCLKGVSCTETNNCQSAQEKCIGKENAEKFSTKDKKHLCECVVDYYLCSLNNDVNKTSCQTNVDSCLTMVIILNGASIPELSTSTQRSFPTANPNFTIELIEFQPQSSVSELIENIAKNISMLAENDTQTGNQNIRIQVKNDIPENAKLNGTIILDKVEDTNTITLVSLNPQVQFQPNSDTNEIVIDTSDLINENPSDRQKIAQQRIENVLRQITTDFQFGLSSTEKPDLQMGITSRINPAITMSASTAFMDDFFNTTESPPNLFTQISESSLPAEKSTEDFVVDFDLTVESHNLFEVIAAAVTSYATQSASQPKDIIFTIQQTDKKSEPVIMIQMSEFTNNTIVNIKISNDTIFPSIIKVLPQEFIQVNENNNLTFDETKLALILEEQLINSEISKPIELSPEEIAEVLSTLVDVNDEKKMEILISNKTVKALINNNNFNIISTVEFPHEEKFNLDLSEMPMEPSDVFLNNEVKELIYRQFLMNLKPEEESLTEATNKDSQFQLELPTFGISISSQNISSNLTQPIPDSRDDNDETLLSTETTTSGKSVDGIMTFPMFGFNISSGIENQKNSTTTLANNIKNGSVEWEGKKNNEIFSCKYL